MSLRILELKREVNKKRPGVAQLLLQNYCTKPWAMDASCTFPAWMQ